METRYVPLHYRTPDACLHPEDVYKRQWYDKNGNLTKTYSADDAVFLGKQRYAPWSGGFGTRLAWKGITVSADFSFMLGQYLSLIHILKHCFVVQRLIHFWRNMRKLLPI